MFWLLSTPVGGISALESEILHCIAGNWIYIIYLCVSVCVCVYPMNSPPQNLKMNFVYITTMPTHCLGGQVIVPFNVMFERVIV